MTGNPLVDKIVMGINGLLLTGSIGIFVYTNIIAKRPLVDEAFEERQLETQARDSIRPTMVKMDKLTINIQSRTQRLRFIDLEVYLETYKPDQVQTIEDKKANILDTIIDVAGRMKPVELNSLAGKILLEDRIKKALNASVAKPLVKRVFFSTFVVQ